MSDFPSDAAVRWRERREAEARVIAAVHEHAMMLGGPRLVIRGWRRFAPEGPVEPGAGADAGDHVWPLFRAWFAFGFTPRHELTLEDCGNDPELLADLSAGVDSSWPTTTIAEHWADFATGIPDADRYFAFEASRCPWSLYLVSNIDSGAGLSLRDLLTGGAVEVYDPIVAARVRRDDILVTAVLTDRELSTLIGPAPYAIPGQWRVEALDIRRGHSDEDWIAQDEIGDMSYEVFDVYKHACEDGFSGAPCGLAAPMHVLTYRPGEWMPALLRWRVGDDFAAVLEALRPLTRYDDSDEITMECSPDGEPRAFAVWCITPPASPGAETDVEMHGYLYLEGGELVADVPTENDADALVIEIARALPGATLIERRAAGDVRLVDDLPGR